MHNILLFSKIFNKMFVKEICEKYLVFVCVCECFCLVDGSILAVPGFATRKIEDFKILSIQDEFYYYSLAQQLRGPSLIVIGWFINLNG